MNTVPDASPVFIETLKLDVCARVQKWSEDRGKKQTPTLTMHVNGNMPIAFTKRAEISQAAPTLASDLSFEERLSRLRAAEVVNEAFYPNLEATIDSLEVEMQKESKEFDYFGMRLISTLSIYPA